MKNESQGGCLPGASIAGFLTVLTITGAVTLVVKRGGRQRA